MSTCAAWQEASVFVTRTLVRFWRDESLPEHGGCYHVIHLGHEWPCSITVIPYQGVFTELAQPWTWYVLSFTADKWTQLVNLSQAVGHGEVAA